MDNLKAQGTKAFIWDLLGKLARHGMGFVVTLFLARLLEPSDFGLIAIVMVVIGLASIFMDVGLGAALIQRPRVRPIHYSSVFYFNIVVGLFLTGITYFSAPWISEFYDNEQLLFLTQVLSLSFIIGALGSVQGVRLRKELNYAFLTKLGLTSSLVSGVVGISLALWGAGVWSLVAQSLTGGILYNILIWTRVKWVPGFKFSWKALTQLWGFGFRMFLAGLIEAIYMRMDYIIIGKLFPLDILGFYQRAKSLNLMVVQYSSGSLMSVLFPTLSKVQNDIPRFQNIVIKGFGIISFVTFFLLGTLYVISEELIIILFSDKWLLSVEYFKILVLSGFAYPVSALLVNVLVSLGKSKINLKLQIYKKMVAFSNLGIGFLFGIEGFLYGLIIVSIINISLNVTTASRESSIPANKFYIPIIVQSAITFISLLVTLYLVDTLEVSDIISLLIKGILFALSYLFLNWIFKASSFKYFLEQFYPIFVKTSNKIKNIL